MKKYVNPMLQVVSINKTNIIATSLGVYSTETNTQLAADRFRDDWDAGY